MKPRYLGYILVSLIASFSIVSVLISVIEFNVYFETIDIGHICTHRERRDYIIQTQQEWDDLWPSSEAPDIDFSSNIVLAVYMGEQTTGGYHIEIMNISENVVLTRVYIRETSPSPHDFTIPTLTQPYHIVKINRNPRIIVFIHNYDKYLERLMFWSLN